MRREFVINNEQGIHARPATVLVQKANQFESDIHITFGDITTDLKSIMAVLSLGVTKGSLIFITIEGSDQQEAMNGIADIITKINLEAL